MLRRNGEIFIRSNFELPSRVTGPLRGVIVKCSRGKGGPGLIFPLECREERGGDVPGVGEVDLKYFSHFKIFLLMHFQSKFYQIYFS